MTDVCLHRWQIPAASGKREDVATCNVCGATKLQPISWPYDWPGISKLRQNTGKVRDLPGVSAPPPTVLPKTYSDHQVIRLPGSREKRRST